MAAQAPALLDISANDVLLNCSPERIIVELARQTTEVARWPGQCLEPQMLELAGDQGLDAGAVGSTVGGVVPALVTISVRVATPTRRPRGSARVANGRAGLACADPISTGRGSQAPIPALAPRPRAEGVADCQPLCSNWHEMEVAMTEKIGLRRGWTALTGLLALGPVVGKAGGAAVAARTGLLEAVPFDQSLGEFVFGGARGGAEREVRS